MKLFSVLLLSIFTLLPKFAFSQEETFKPSGKIIARGFLDFSQGLNDVSNKSGFDITRAFLGYNYKITKTLQAQVIIDGASGNNQGKLEVYLRNAFINWRDKGFDISIGEIGLLQFSTQQDYWKHRYVMQSFQGLNKMAPGVDLGITAKYVFSNYLSADISITNGEGYKKVVKNNSTRYAAGLNFYPTKNIILRAYTDIYNQGEADQRDSSPEGVVEDKLTDQKTLSLFGGYQDKFISGGIEYNRVFNKGFIKDKDYYGYSTYSSVKIASQWRVYARYDIMKSKAPSSYNSPWNSLDGQLIVAGLEFQPIKELKISPNFRNINRDRNKSEQYLFVNLEFNL